jgi:hypothetical protein
MSDSTRENAESGPHSTPNGGDYSLREVEQHFAELVAGVEDHAIFLLDPRGIVKSWNAGFWKPVFSEDTQPTTPQGRPQ